jgi:predicted alpha/beta hydrolase family esterase
MNDVVIIHGKPSKDVFMNVAYPSPSNLHWYPWLQHELLVRGLHTQTPEMPIPYVPVYEAWRDTLEQFSLHDQSVLVGHSCGAGFLVRWLSENPERQLKKVVLVAPSLGLDWDARGFFDFTINPALQSAVKEVVILVAKDDREGIQNAVKQIATALPAARVVTFETGGHFTRKSLGHIDFPELLEEVTK